MDARAREFIHRLERVRHEQQEYHALLSALRHELMALREELARLRAQNDALAASAPRARAL